MKLNLFHADILNLIYSVLEDKKTGNHGCKIMKARDKIRRVGERDREKKKQGSRVTVIFKATYFNPCNLITSP